MLSPGTMVRMWRIATWRAPGPAGTPEACRAAVRRPFQADVIHALKCGDTRERGFRETASGAVGPPSGQSRRPGDARVRQVSDAPPRTLRRRGDARQARVTGR